MLRFILFKCICKYKCVSLQDWLFAIYRVSKGRHYLALAEATSVINIWHNLVSRCPICLKIYVPGMLYLHARYTTFQKDWTPWNQVMPDIYDRGFPSLIKEMPPFLTFLCFWAGFEYVSISLLMRTVQVKTHVVWCLHTAATLSRILIESHQLLLGSMSSSFHCLKEMQSED